MSDGAQKRGISRREFAKGAAAGALAGAGGGALFGSPAGASPHHHGDKPSRHDPCDSSRDLALVNGKFIDARGYVASSLAIKDGRIFAVGKAHELTPCAETINLKGRVVIPGLVDSHAHFTRAGTNPGYETRWIETTFSIAEVQKAVAERAKTVPRGSFITCAGGWNANQLAEARLPTKAELDAAAPRHAVYLSGRTNTLGKAFFEANGLTVDDVGQVSSTAAATTALRSIQTPDDKIRGTADIIAFAAATGLTTIHDTSNLTVQPDDYAYMNTLYQRSGRSLDVRMRHYRYFGGDATLEQLTTYMDPIYREAGDDVYRINGVGEQVGSADNFGEHLHAVAQAGWRITQHTLSAADHPHHFDHMIMVGQEFDIRDLRWSLAHVTLATQEQILGLKAVGAGVTVQDFSYLSASAGANFRMIVDSGIPVGAGTDSTNVAPLNPWLSLFYMVTGRNNAGVLTNGGRQISRLEALRLYTTGSAWFSREENEVGSFEVGKLADLAVLSDDYFRVPEDRIRKITSHLTLQGGRVVHKGGPFSNLRI
jgi:predicted amidohydrolase YtcJ